MVNCKKRLHLGLFEINLSYRGPFTSRSVTNVTSVIDKALHNTHLEKVDTHFIPKHANGRIYVCKFQKKCFA